MIVFSQHVSPRLTYVVDFLSHYYGHKFALTHDKHEYLNSGEGRINYSDAKIADPELLIRPEGLLQKKGVEPIEPDVSPCGGVPALFINNSETGFDIFSAIFYLLSRYEEYLPHTKDSYGRYAHTNSLAFRQGFLKQPVIDQWLETFTGKVRTFTHVELPARTFRFIPTYDIDIAWSYQGKGWLRNIGGLIRSLGKGEIAAARDRLAVLAGKSEDPFDSYRWMNDLHQSLQLQPIYFFHVGKNRTKYDKNIPPEDPQLRDLIKSVSQKHEIGLHPSWHSGDEASALNEEKKTLEDISGKEINKSRQHYIRFTLPETYRQLLSAGIREDHSMGYGSINGFRASTGSSFYWYDLGKETATELLIRPFCFMDANSFYEQKDSPEQALDEMKKFHVMLQHCGGEMISIFHNNFLGSGREFAGWREVYSDFLSSLR